MPAVYLIFSHNFRIADRNHVTPFLRKILGLNWLLMTSCSRLRLWRDPIYSATYMRKSVGCGFWRKQAKGGLSDFRLKSPVNDYRWVRWGALPCISRSGIFDSNKSLAKRFTGAQLVHLGR